MAKNKRTNPEVDDEGLDVIDSELTGAIENLDGANNKVQTLLEDIEGPPEPEGDPVQESPTSANTPTSPDSGSPTKE
jgi:hypothetical protein